MPAIKGTQFQVKLGGLKLPAEVERRIALEIRALVMRELAHLDLKGDLRILPGLKVGPGTLGFIAEILRR